MTTSLLSQSFIDAANDLCSTLCKIRRQLEASDSCTHISASLSAQEQASKLLDSKALHCLQYSNNVVARARDGINLLRFSLGNDSFESNQMEKNELSSLSELLWHPRGE